MVSGARMSRARGPWTASTAQAVRHVLDPDVETADETLEVGEVRLGRGQDELVVGEPQDDAVLDDEAAIVAPGRVLRVARRARPDVASEDAGQEALGVWPVDPVLVER